MSVSFIGSLSQVIKQGTPTMLCTSRDNCVSVYPSRDYYIDHTNNWDEVFTATSFSAREAPAVGAFHPEEARPLAELRWRAAYHEALRQPSNTGNSGDLLQLVSWPNITRLPEEHVIPVIQICSLLWRKPTVGYLVARVLDFPVQEVNALLKLLHDLGHVVAPRAALPDALTEGGTHVSDEPAMANAKAQESPRASLVSKLWQRLVGR